MSYETRIRQQLNKNPNSYSIVGAHTQDTTISSATVIALPAGANGLLIQATGQAIRYTLDGTTPTSSLGFVLATSFAPVLITFPGDDTVLTVIESAASAAIEYQAVRISG